MTGRVSIERIKTVAAADFGVPVAAIVSPRRHRKFIEPRHVAIYLACSLSDRTSGTIGRLFGGRDHSTIFHAHRRIAELRCTDRAVDERIRRIEHELEPPTSPRQEFQLSFLIGPLFDQAPNWPQPTLRMAEAA